VAGKDLKELLAGPWDEMPRDQGVLDRFPEEVARALTDAERARACVFAGLCSGSNCAAACPPGGPGVRASVILEGVDGAEALAERLLAAGFRRSLPECPTWLAWCTEDRGR
jgi:dienelactone hydrolase